MPLINSTGATLGLNNQMKTDQEIAEAATEHISHDVIWLDRYAEREVKDIILSALRDARAAQGDVERPQEIARKKVKELYELFGRKGHVDRDDYLQLFLSCAQLASLSEAPRTESGEAED